MKQESKRSAGLLRHLLHKQIERLAQAELELLYALASAQAVQQQRQQFADQLQSLPLPEHWEPLSEAALRQSLDESEAQIKQGQYLDTVQIKKLIESW